jgi:multidrug resistance efflux pump
LNLNKNLWRPGRHGAKYLILPAVLCVLLTGCGVSAQNPIVPPAEAVQAAYTYSGNIDAENKQNCVAGAALTITEIRVQEGDYVHKGDVLFAFDDSDVSAQISQANAGVAAARANLEKAELAVSGGLIAAQAAFDTAAAAFNDARSNLDRMAALYEAGAIPEVQYEQAKTAFVAAQGQYAQAENAYENAEAQNRQNLNAAQAQLSQAQAAAGAAESAASKRRVFAETDGTVADVWVNENTTPAIGQKIMDVVDYDKLILEVPVDQFEIEKFAVGEQLSVYVNPLDLTVAGTVGRISNQAVMTGELSNFIVTIYLEKNDKLKTGMMAECQK